MSGVERNPDTAAIARNRFGLDVTVATLNEAELPEASFDAVQFSERTIHNTLGRAGFVVSKVRHRRIPLGCTFGSPPTVLSDPKRLAYTAVFAPLAVIGPAVRGGDTMMVSARRE